MEKVRADLCVIGAGAGGLSVAAGAAQMGARVVLIEGGEMGGDCLNHGCVPSKALLAAAGQAHAMTAGAPFGIATAQPEVDFTAVRAHVARVIAAIAPHDSQERFEGLGVRVIRDWARFVSPEAVEAGGLLVTARRFVIATGSAPRVPDIPGLAATPYLTNETIFALPELPMHLLILGGGAVGLELAQAFRRLGSRVTVIEAGRALGREDPEAVALLLARLRAEGVEIVEGAEVADIAGGEGAIRLRIADGRIFEGSHLLLAAGRRPDLARLDLTRAGVAHDEKGVTVDARLRSPTNRRVFAVGDAAGGQFTYVAGHHAGIVIRQALLALPAKAESAHIPRAIYTDPELAQVGLTEAEARAAHGARLSVVRTDLAANDRAQTEGATEGFVKVMVVRGRPVGVTIAAAGAGEMIGLWTLALAGRVKMSTLAGAILPYPTRNETAKRAAGACFSPRLFDNPWLKRGVRLVQRLLP